MTEAEFLAELNRVEIDKGKEYSPDRRRQLYQRLKGFGGWSWRQAVDQLLDVHETQALPVQGQMVAALNAVTSPRRQGGKPAREELGTSRIERAASKVFYLVLRLARQDGREAVDELHVVARAVAQSRPSCPSECICDRGLLTFQRLRDEGGEPIRKAYSGPCPNGCDRAEEIAKEIGRRVRIPVVDLDTQEVSGWVGPPKSVWDKRRQVLDADPDAQVVWR